MPGAEQLPKPRFFRSQPVYLLSHPKPAPAILLRLNYSTGDVVSRSYVHGRAGALG